MAVCYFMWDMNRRLDKIESALEFKLDIKLNGRKETHRPYQDSRAYNQHFDVLASKATKVEVQKQNNNER